VVATKGVTRGKKDRWGKGKGKRKKGKMTGRFSGRECLC
jgi:hypothetical protein